MYYFNLKNKLKTHLDFQNTGFIYKVKKKFKFILK